MYRDDDILFISGLQHLAFCERQWELIYVEQLWSENILTIEGAHLHGNVHCIGSKSRGDTRFATGLRLRSSRLGLYGVADMVEFHRDDALGIVPECFKDKSKRWIVYPVEYKRGRKRWDIADELQLCAQAICLEEMLHTEVTCGAVYYGEPKRRIEVTLTEELRGKVELLCAKAARIASGAERPRYNLGKHCNSCSMKEYCLPECTRSNDHSSQYVFTLYKQVNVSADGGICNETTP